LAPAAAPATNPLAFIPRQAARRLAHPNPNSMNAGKRRMITKTNTQRRRCARRRSNRNRSRRSKSN
jgi:hypothetical protein